MNKTQSVALGFLVIGILASDAVFNGVFNGVFNSVFADVYLSDAYFREVTYVKSIAHC